MTNNTTPINESINTTANGTGYWRPFEKGELPDVQTFLLNTEIYFSDMLVSWGLEPNHVFFQLLIGAAVVIIFYIIYVKVTTSSSKIFTPLFYIAVAIVILLILGVV